MGMLNNWVYGEYKSLIVYVVNQSINQLVTGLGVPLVIIHVIFGFSVKKTSSYWVPHLWKPPYRMGHIVIYIYIMI